MILWHILRSTRPRQWIKNLLVFAALVFSRNLRDMEMMRLAGLAFLVFCGVSGSIYLVNDILDRKRDRKHPLKRFRPLASGALPVGVAWVSAIMICGGSVYGAFTVSRPLGIVVAIFLVLQLAYSIVLKHVMLLDAIAIALGFMLRAIAGAKVIDVPASSWMIVTTLFLALFLALNKRRAEITMLGDDAAAHRESLGQYPPALLDQLILVTTGCVVMCYALYTFQSGVQSEHLVWSIPLVVYGVFRYLYLVNHRGKGSIVEETLLRDLPLLVCVLAWAVLIVVLMAMQDPIGSS